MEEKKQDQQKVAGAHREPGDAADHSSSGVTEGQVVGGMYVQNPDDQRGSKQPDDGYAGEAAEPKAGSGAMRQLDESPEKVRDRQRKEKDVETDRAA